MARTTRRAFLQQSLAACALPAALQSAVNNTEPMKITKIEAVTFRQDIKIGGGNGGSDATEFCWVRLHTDKGIVGTGETYPFHQGEIGALKDYSRTLIGRDPRDIDGIWRAFYHRMAMRNAGGADMRILSAINMAQLDILGLASGLPLYRLLGGRTRQRVRVYNTTTDYWAINNTKMGPDTMKIVQFLLDRGITAMKIYPFSAPITTSPTRRSTAVSLGSKRFATRSETRWTSASTAGAASISPAPSALPKPSNPTTSCTSKTPC
jgi:L-alanine-DL-glutamate epimerase-like enolase superfamily enzyme